MDKDKIQIDLKLYEESESLQNLLQLMPEIIANMAPIAKLYKAAYDALKEEGFTDLQAMEIIKARGHSLL